MPYDPDITYRRESRTLERSVRLICGGAFGLVPGLWLVAELGLLEDAAAFVVLGVCVLTCASLALRYGDEFWHAAANAIRAIF